MLINQNHNEESNELSSTNLDPDQDEVEIIVSITPEPENSLSIYNTDLEFKTKEKIYVSEMYLLENILNIAKENNWDYSSSKTVPLTTSDVYKIPISTYLTKEKARSSRLTVPNNLENLYISSSAANEIESIILKARAEYLAFLLEKGVDQKYLDEIDNNAFPSSLQRIKYYPENDPDSPPSVTQAFISSDGFKDDFSKLQMDIYPTDIFNNAGIFIESGILGPSPTSDTELKEFNIKARNLGLRYLIYHEMTHVLQRAFDTVNAPEKYKKLKSSWVNNERALFKVTDKYNIRWSESEISNEIYNRTINNESQADGVAYQILIDTYNMSSIQSNLAWEFMHGRLTQARDQWDRSMQYLQDEQSELDISDISTIIFDSLSRFYTPGSEEIILILRLTGRLGGLDAYGGYFHPMLVADSQEFWDYLKS